MYVYALIWFLPYVLLPPSKIDDCIRFYSERHQGRIHINAQQPLGVLIVCLLHLVCVIIAHRETRRSVIDVEGGYCEVATGSYLFG